MRMQLALNVQDLSEAIDYYSNLFDAQPHKLRDGYANFAIDNPPLKLVLMENPQAKDRINHLGVELDEKEDLGQVKQRLQGAGLAEKVEDQTVCCFATQNKVWSTEPQGINWEWYTITNDNPDVETAKAQGCCT